jgi:TatD DNase family protein
LRSAAPDGVRGVVHCFTGGTAQARLLVGEFGLRLGIGGVVTFKGAQDLRDAVADIGLEHVILETDAPYLAPVPHRGRRNEPAFVAATAAALAALFGTSVEAVADRTSENALALFGPRA